MHMKKIFFAFCTMALCLFLNSCGTEGCSISGTWSVSDVKLESTKFSESLIGMMETEYLNSMYTFNDDGTMSISGSNGVMTPGTFTYDAKANNLQWKDNNSDMDNILQILNCSENSIQIVQRMPPDPEQELTVQVTMTLTKYQNKF